MPRDVGVFVNWSSSLTCQQLGTPAMTRISQHGMVLIQALPEQTGSLHVGPCLKWLHFTTLYLVSFSGGIHGSSRV